MLAQHVVDKYFDTLDQSIGTLLRNRLPFKHIDNLLNSIKFRDKNSDMILVGLKQVADTFLEAIFNPGNMDHQPIQFGLHSSPSSSVILTASNLLSQMQHLKSLFSIQPQTTSKGSLVHRENLTEVRTTLDLLVGLCRVDHNLSTQIDREPYQYRTSQQQSSERYFCPTHTQLLQHMHPLAPPSLFMASLGQYLPPGLQSAHRTAE